MKWFDAQFRALGADELPPTVALGGRALRLEQTFTHGFAAAVGLYRCGDDAVVCKFHRRARFFGIPLRGIGELLARYEAAALKQCEGLEGVPRLRGVPAPDVVARQFVPGRPLERGTKVSDDFFPRLLALLDSLHRRGVTYNDLEKLHNILVGDDGRPYLIDFQTAYWAPRRLLGETTLLRALRSVLAECDLYHARKHFRRVRPDLLTEAQIAETRRRPAIIRAANALTAPYMAARRRLFRRNGGDAAEATGE